MQRNVEYVQLKKLVQNRLVSGGVPASDAEVVATHLLEAEAHGYGSHGLSRLPAILSQEGPVAEPTITTVGQTSAIYDAGGQLGIAAMHGATNLCTAAAKRGGISAVAVRNYRGTTGELGAYARQAARDDVVAITVVGSDYAVAPVGSSRAILGTNPIAIGFPNGATPFSADIATAAWSYGRIKQAERAGQRIPEGVVQTEEGLPSTDPADADNGSQLPMSGHKGYALGLAIELLTGPLVGGKAGRDAVRGGHAGLVIGIAADLFRESTAVANDVHALFEEVRTAPLAPGASKIRIPGASHARSDVRTIAVSDEDYEMLTHS